MTTTYKLVSSNVVENGVEKENIDFKTPSKLRQTVSQCAAVMAKNCLIVTFGSTIGFATILIPALQDKNAELKISLEELTWIGSINYFVLPLGCLVSGPVSQRFGRKKVMMWTNVPFVTTWLLFYFSTNSTWIFVALIVGGLTGGLIESSVLTYVAEVTQPHLRGMLSATTTLASIIGVFTQMITGSFVSWRTACLVNLIYPVISFSALVLVPESPFWLAGKGHLKEAEESLCWLRGWVKSNQVTDEFQAICENVLKHRQQSLMRQEQRPLVAYLKRTFYIPFGLVSLCFFIISFGGCATLQTFAVIIFADLNAPIDKYNATVLLGLVQLIGTLIGVSAIHFVGRRKLTFISISGSGSCFFLAAIYGILIHQQVINKNSCTWFPTLLMIGAAFFTHTGVRIIPWILASEVFPANVRSIAVGASGSLGFIFTSISNKIFFYTTNGLTLSGTFLFYGVVNLISFIVLYFIMPETEGRTLTEIEDHFAGIKSLHEQPLVKSK